MNIKFNIGISGSLVLFIGILFTKLQLNELWAIYDLLLMLIVAGFPRWRSAIIGMTIVSLFRYTCEFAYNDLDFKLFLHISLGNLMNWLIVLLFTFFYIRSEKMKKEFHQMALIDPLTRVYNRRYFEEIVDNDGGLLLPYSMIMFDIDHFKNLNDTYGHEFGDRVLKKLCSIVSANLRDENTLVRVGGEEFVILLPDTEVKIAQQIAERIRKMVSEFEMKFREGTDVKITISLGVSSMKQNDSFKELFLRSDKALYASKQNGRNKVSIG